MYEIQVEYDGNWSNDVSGCSGDDNIFATADAAEQLIRLFIADWMDCEPGLVECPYRIVEIGGYVVREDCITREQPGSPR